MNFAQMLERETNNETITANGRQAFSSSLNTFVDALSEMGNFAHTSDDKVLDVFTSMYLENPTIATRLLFFNRDVRGGQKIRKMLQVVLRNIDTFPLLRNWLLENLSAVVEYGYWKDLYNLHETTLWGQVVEFWIEQIANDFVNLSDGNKENISLAAKYAPSERQNKSNHDEKFVPYFLAHFPHPKVYRKMIVSLRKHLDIVERKMSNNKWSEIKYSSVPSVAFKNYADAFMRHDEERFTEFLNDDTETVNASVLNPINLVTAYKKSSDNFWRTSSLPDEEDMAIEKQWKHLQELGLAESTILPIIDVSGSMTLKAGNGFTCLDVAHSMCVYFSEQLKGPYHNSFLLFSRNTKFYSFNDGDSLLAKLITLHRFSEVANTDIDKAFQLILDVARNNNVPQSELPSKLLLVSDMQFDSAVDNRNVVDKWQEEYAKYGYELPLIIFWNVASTYNNKPTTARRNGAVLISGYSPQILNNIVRGNVATSVELLEQIITDERYNWIHVV